MSEFGSRKVYVAGEEGSPMPSKTGRPVRIEEIRAKYSRDNLFEDVDFPPALSTIGDIGGDSARALNMKPLVESYTWARAHELCKIVGLTDTAPEFVIAKDEDGHLCCSEHDAVQGAGLGDCFFAAGLAELTKKPGHCDFVVPADNFDGFADDKYVGAFHFRFYVPAHDKWVDVVVDDWLPVDGEMPAFAKISTVVSGGRSVFWVALAEKAYAKLHGSYFGIEGGYPSHSLVNLCGGFAEIMRCNSMDSHGLNYIEGGPLSDSVTSIKNFLLTYVHTENFLALDTYNRTNRDYASVEEGYLANGLHAGHAYSVLDVQELKLKSNNTITKVLVQLRNPWGHDEWTGPYGDADDAGWGELEKDLRQGVKRDEGVFWMELPDLLKYFYNIEICHFGLTDGTKLSLVRGVWPAALQTLPDQDFMYDDEYLRLISGYRFEVKQGAIAAKYSGASGGKALLLFTLVLEGHRAGLKPDPRMNIRLFKITADMRNTSSVKEITAGVCPIRDVSAVGREASCWLFVDPGAYLLVPVLRTAPWPGKSKALPVEFEDKPMTYALRVFSENAVEFETIPGAP